MTQPLTATTFQLLPGEKVQHVVGMPGPDTDDCEVISQEGDAVKIRFQVWGKGPVLEDTVPLSLIVWRRGSPTSQRYHAWVAAGGVGDR